MLFIQVPSGQKTADKTVFFDIPTRMAKKGKVTLFYLHFIQKINVFSKKKKKKNSIFTAFLPFLENSDFQKN